MDVHLCQGPNELGPGKVARGHAGQEHVVHGVAGVRLQQPLGHVQVTVGTGAPQRRVVSRLSVHATGQTHEPLGHMQVPPGTRPHKGPVLVGVGRHGPNGVHPLCVLQVAEQARVLKGNRVSVRDVGKLALGQQPHRHVCVATGTGTQQGHVLVALDGRARGPGRARQTVQPLDQLQISGGTGLTERDVLRQTCHQPLRDVRQPEVKRAVHQLQARLQQPKLLIRVHHVRMHGLGLAQVAGQTRTPQAQQHGHGGEHKCVCKLATTAAQCCASTRPAPGSSTGTAIAARPLRAMPYTRGPGSAATWPHGPGLPSTPSGMGHLRDNEGQ